MFNSDLKATKLYAGKLRVNNLPFGKSVFNLFAMIQLNNKNYTCPVDVSLSFVNGKWKILILSHLDQFGARGFSEIRKNLPGVSEKMLTQQLKQLENDELIKKVILSSKPYRVEYSLTTKGESLSPMFKFLSEWGIAFLRENGIDYLKDQELYKLH